MKCIAMFTFLSTLLAASLDLVAEAPLIPPDAVVEVVSTGDYRFTEGPALAPDGSIYFSDIPNDRIYCYEPETGETTLFTDDSGGANGLMFHNGYLYACAGKARQIRRYEPVMDTSHRWITVSPEPDGWVLGNYAGKRYNGPNDLVFIGNRLFVTDPNYGRHLDQELRSEAVFGFVLKRNSTSLYRLIENLERPNGIGVSPDGKTLYVMDNRGKLAMAYDVLDESRGTKQLANPRQFADLSDLGGPDGMTVDHAGRLYVAIFGKGILILSPEGHRLGFLETGPQTTNCVFGADGRTLYVTAEKALKRVVLNTGAEAD